MTQRKGGKNTKQAGFRVRAMVYKEGRIWLGVALEFNIAVEGKTEQETRGRLFEAVHEYFELVRSRNLSDGILNQVPLAEHEDLWHTLLERNRVRRRAIPSPYLGLIEQHVLV